MVAGPFCIFDRLERRVIADERANAVLANYNVDIGR
jgi:hypothetical protein